MVRITLVKAYEIIIQAAGFVMFCKCRPGCICTSCVSENEFLKKYWNH